jgi:hypothetical protein
VNNPDLRAAAKAIMRAEPEIGKRFSEERVEELIRILAKRLVIAGALNALED